MKMVIKKVRQMERKNSMSSSSKSHRKVLLWLALFLQLLIIGAFWLPQIMHNYQTPHIEDEVQSKTLRFTTNNLQHAGVYFIKKVPYDFPSSDKGPDRAENLKIEYNVNFFKDDFKQLTYMNDNKTQTWCFIEGTQQPHTIDTEMEYQCNCQLEWHGSDCSQPEVVWRALMTSRRQPLKLRTEPSKEPVRLIYIIHGNFLNLLLLELQIEAVQHVVDYFIIFYNRKNINNDKKNYDLKLMKKHLHNIFKKSSSYVLLQCPQEHKTCHAQQVFSLLQKQHQQQQKQQLNAFELKPTDACLMSDDHTILSMHSLKYYKYYAKNYERSNIKRNLTVNSEIWRFRLKHNVYGFFWQHPQKTQIAGVLTNCANFITENNHNKNNKVNYIDLRSTRILTNEQFIVGDLNHFGGWYCEYCQQPEEIISELLLQAEFNMSYNKLNMKSNFVSLSNKIENKDIHAVDLQTFISHGIYVDGKLRLLKIRRHDKYFAPSTVLNNTMGKYSNFILNMYESLDDDLFDEDYINGL